MPLVAECVKHFVWSGQCVRISKPLTATLNPQHGEIKSMRTHPDFLRQGVASMLLDHIITTARTRGYRRLSLETGSGEAFVPAIRLYESRGFFPCAAFSDYSENPFSRFYGLEL